MKFSVPQGTVFGPVFFILYMNNISNAPVKGYHSIILFTNMKISQNVKRKAENGFIIKKQRFFL